MKKHLFVSILIVSLFAALFSACEFGMGTALDLEAPVISVKSLKSASQTVSTESVVGAIYCHKNVSFYGTAKDNVKLKSVYAEIKWSNETSYHYLASATCTGDSWYLDLNFGREGTAYLKFVVEDMAGNSSAKSTQVLTLFVDETAPVGTGWYIDRGNGFRYSLQYLETLKNVDLDLSENKDAAQNVGFTIHADFNDTMGIKDNSIKLKIYDEQGNKVCELPNISDSNYAPEFKVTHDALVAGSSALSSGRHYLQIRYDAEDVVTVPESNKVEDKEVDMGWFIWYPESDSPKIIPQAQSDSNGAINLKIKDTLSLSVFDDDGLTGTHTFYLKEGSTVIDSKNVTFEGEREATVVLAAPGTPKTLTLTGTAKDNTTAAKTCSVNKTVNVTDDSAPMLLITSPENNKIPSVTMSDANTKAIINVVGQSLDTTGCEYLEFVWVPDSVAQTGKKDVALSWLDSLQTDEQHSALKPTGSNDSKVTEKDGLKMWSVKLTAAGSSGDFKKQTFSFNMDLLNDFVSNSTNERKNAKYFLVKLTRADKKYSYTEYTLASDNLLPSISSVNPTGEMSIVESSDDLVLEFKGVKESGLAMNPAGYKIEKIEGSVKTELSGSYNESTQTYKTTVSKSQLAQMKEAGEKPKYMFTARDLFDNEGYAQYTIVISDLPKLTSITATSPATCKKGDEIIFNANFSDTVYVDDGLTGTNLPYLKIKGITNSSNSNRDKAYYKQGSGSTSLQFSYIVQENDITSGVAVVDINADSMSSPIVINGATKLGSDKVHLAVNWANSVTGKNIKVDGVSPKITTIVVESDATAANKNGEGYACLKAGRKLTVTVSTDKDITIQGTPTFVFKVGSATSESTLEIPFERASGSSIVFSKKIEDSDANGILYYVESSCIKNSDVIKDKVGNGVILLSGTSAKDSKIFVDTGIPLSPSIKNAETNAAFSSSSTKYRESVKFLIEDSTDTTIKSTEYSLDGGSTWTSYAATHELKPDAGSSNLVVQLTARRTDWAGNVSEYPDPVTIDISKSFPSFTIECTDVDGYYKPGSKLTFRVSFAQKVNVAKNAAAKIYLSDAGQYAAVEASTAQSGVTTAYFTYTVKKTDQFTLEVDKTIAADKGVHLDGITDLYGFSNSSDMDENYTRDIVCDGVIPYVDSMSPNGETASGSNIYKNGNVVTIKFNEPVQQGEGNIILRQVAGWAIPPVLTGDDFNTIRNAIPDDYVLDGVEGKDILSMRNASGADLEDSECLFGASVGPAQDRYHGTGQYVGPYQKTTQGLNADYSPDVSTKYVLDFDIDIWETTETHPIGLTFTQGRSTNANAYSKTSSLDQATPLTPSSTRSAGQIRTVLEKVGYHERIVDVTSSSVRQIDEKTFIVTFPKGLTGGAELADGREWELVISKGAFLDYAENEFGSEYTSASETVYTTTKTTSDAVMKKGDSAISGTLTGWGRGRTSASDPVVLIQTANGKNSFWSDKVAEPVIRVDRYSYGLGFKQSNADGSTSVITRDSTVPTGYVRVRIDCETRGATIKYNKDGTSNSRDDENSSVGAYYANTDNANCYSYITVTSGLTNKESKTLNITGSTAIDSSPVIFAGGYAGYEDSYKQYIVAQGTKEDFTPSERGVEGVFKTVVRFKAPSGSTGNCAERGTGQTDLSIRGTTGFAGEPSISPFPLRDSQIASPYLKRCFRERTLASKSTSLDYYWVSFEILVPTSFSGYSWHNGQYYDWCQNWGLMNPGEFTYCVGLRNWG